MTKAQKQRQTAQKEREKQKDIFNSSSSFVETANNSEILRQWAHKCAPREREMVDNVPEGFCFDLRGAKIKIYKHRRPPTAKNQSTFENGDI